MLAIFVPVSIAICRRWRPRKAALRFCPVSGGRHAKRERLWRSVTGSRSCEMSNTGDFFLAWRCTEFDQPVYLEIGFLLDDGCEPRVVWICVFPPAAAVIDCLPSPGSCRDRGRSGARDHLALHRWLDDCRAFVRGRICATSTPAGRRANPREVLFDMDEAG